MENVVKRVSCDNWHCTFNQRGYCINKRIDEVYRNSNKIICDMIKENNINMDDDRRKEDLYYQK